MAGIVRRAQVRSAPAFSFEDLAEQGRAIVEEARREAAAIVERAGQAAVKHAEKIEAEARIRGEAAGREEGAAEARKEAGETALVEVRGELASLSQALVEGLQVFEENKRRLLGQAESGLIELSLSIARRVCKHDVGASSEAALANARAVAEIAKHEHDLRLHMNSADYELLRESLPDALGAIDGLEHVEIVADESVARGGCVLRSRDGTIDASIDEQLDRVARALVTTGGSETQPHNDSETVSDNL